MFKILFNWISVTWDKKNEWKHVFIFNLNWRKSSKTWRNGTVLTFARNIIQSQKVNEPKVIKDVGDNNKHQI